MMSLMRVARNLNEGGVLPEMFILVNECKCQWRKQDYSLGGIYYVGYSIINQTTLKIVILFQKYVFLYNLII